MTNIVNDLRLLESGARWVDSATADVLERAADEIERLQAEVASLRITLGGKTFSADVPSPIGCPMPGACAQVKEINRLKRELAEAIDRGNDWCDQAFQARAERDRLRKAQEPTTMWRHIKRGSVYREICRAEVQAATGPICEGDMVVIYGDALGHVWARKVSEFEDGRFGRVAALKETGHG
jgi:hypothetical protein